MEELSFRAAERNVARMNDDVTATAQRGHPPHLPPPQLARTNVAVAAQVVAPEGKEEDPKPAQRDAVQEFVDAFLHSEADLYARLTHDEKRRVARALHAPGSVQAYVATNPDVVLMVAVGCAVGATAWACLTPAPMRYRRASDAGETLVHRLLGTLTRRQ